MPVTERPSDRGRDRGRRLLHTLGNELRAARFGAGLSLRRVGQAAGMSATSISRIERAQVPDVSVVALSTLFAVVGQQLSARAFPDGAPIRDAAQARLIERLRSRLADTIRLRTEVPLRSDRHGRAWDGELIRGTETVKLEAETVLYDLQATDRRIAMKMTDDDVDRVILLVADTRRNRRVLREFRELLRERYPLDTREILTALQEGRLPSKSGIAVL